MYCTLNSHHGINNKHVQNSSQNVAMFSNGMKFETDKNNYENISTKPIKALAANVYNEMIDHFHTYNKQYMNSLQDPEEQSYESLSKSSSTGSGEGCNSYFCEQEQTEASYIQSAQDYNSAVQAWNLYAQQVQTMALVESQRFKNEQCASRNENDYLLALSQQAASCAPPLCFPQCTIPATFVAPPCHISMAGFCGHAHVPCKNVYYHANVHPHKIDNSQMYNGSKNSNVNVRESHNSHSATYNNYHGNYNNSLNNNYSNEIKQNIKQGTTKINNTFISKDPTHQQIYNGNKSNRSEKNTQRRTNKTEDVIEKLLRYPIKQQIAKFEHILTKLENDCKDCNENCPKHRNKAKKNTKSSGPMCDSKKHKTNNFLPENDHFSHNLSKTDFGCSMLNKDDSKKGPIKTFLGLYEVHGLLGVGGGGVVYAGVRISDKTPVAIKRIMKEKIKRWGTANGRKVPQEIALMLKVNGHCNVITLHNWYECLDSYVMIMERPSNSIDLFDYIRAVGRITEDEGAYIFRQVVEAVMHVQAKGVLHRDVKDENVIINHLTKSAKLIDFGCGTVLHEKVYTDFSGTPEFYPPEWYTKKQYYGKFASVWSLGVLLYDMLCGEIPFKTKTKITANVIYFKVSLTQEAKHLIMWMLSADEKSRPTLKDILNHPWMNGKRFSG